MKKINFFDYEIKEFVGIEYEPSDFSVGIMSANIVLCFKDENNIQHQLSLDEEQAYKLLEVLKDTIPYIDYMHPKYESFKIPDSLKYKKKSLFERALNWIKKDIKIK